MVILEDYVGKIHYGKRWYDPEQIWHSYRTRTCTTIFEKLKIGQKNNISKLGGDAYILDPGLYPKFK